MSGKDAYVKGALFGLSLYITGVLLMAVAVLLIDPAGIAFILFFLVPAVVIGAALFFWHRWGLIVGILGGAFGLLVLSEDAGLNLGTPASFFTFSMTLLGLLGVLIVLIASLVGFVQYFRSAVPTEVRPAIGTGSRGLAAVLGAVLVVSAVLTGLSADKVSASDKQQATIITGPCSPSFRI